MEPVNNFTTETAMMLVERAATMRVMLVLLAGAAVAGCSKRDARRDSAAVSSTSTTSTTHAQLLAEATSNYTFGVERTPDPVDTTRVRLPGGTLPAITIATATRTSATGRRPSNRFTARLTVRGSAYARMGLAPGVNYVWRDSAGSTSEPARTLIVPADTAYPLMWMKHETDRTPLFVGMSALPRLVMSTKGYGMCDGGCGGGHCVVQEGTGVAVAAMDTTVVIGP